MRAKPGWGLRCGTGAWARPGARLGAWALAGTLGLVACGGGGGNVSDKSASDGASNSTLNSAGGTEAEASSSSGQITARSTQSVSFYAASRFAEQASFGATPALVAQIRSKGFSAWIDEQFALPPTLMDTKTVEVYTDVVSEEVNAFQRNEFGRLAMAAPDQLRMRTTWALYQWVVAGTEGHAAGRVNWYNLLIQNAFGRYPDLLYAAAINPHMGMFLNNAQNRPKSDQCTSCQPNENFARELMQLFSIGVVKLNSDGSTVRDSRGRPVETYAQTDVEELARVLTGWVYNPDPPNRHSRNFGNWSKPMVPSTWPPERDAGQKTVLGRVFPANQPAPKDLADAVELLTKHPNAGPFVALRLIQHLVKSNPSGAYIGRVAAVFRNNGSGQVGDMKALVKAVLLDSEARAGDNPATQRADDGKLREPVLHRMALARGLGCQLNLKPGPNFLWGLWIGAQSPTEPPNVFSYYAPTDRSPGRNLLAPEQQLLNASELAARMGDMNGLRWVNSKPTLQVFRNAGCSALDGMVAAYVAGPAPFADWLSERYFRGAMPPTLRSNLAQIIQAGGIGDANYPDDAALAMFSHALATPYFGVMK